VVETFWIPLLIPNDLPVCNLSNCERQVSASGERLAAPAPIFYEFLRGPRHPEEIAFQNALFPLDRALAYGSAEAQLSANLYRSVLRARGREIDLAIAFLRPCPRRRFVDAECAGFQRYPGPAAGGPKNF
jgi:hypothetical protein